MEYICGNFPEVSLRPPVDQGLPLFDINFDMNVFPLIVYVILLNAPVPLPWEIVHFLSDLQISLTFDIHEVEFSYLTSPPFFVNFSWHVFFIIFWLKYMFRIICIKNTQNILTCSSLVVGE